MKKYIRTAAAAVLLILLMAIPTAAVYTISPKADTVKNYREVYEAIYNALDAQNSYLDVSSWRIQEYDIMDIFTDVLNNSPEFFYVNNKLVYRYNQKGEVTSLSLTYKMTRTQRREVNEYYQTEISYIVNQIGPLHLTKAETALFVHDYLISSYAYDETETIFDVYNFLKERKGVCHAYALCYIAVMRELDIPCFMVVSEEMNHSWNLVQIDGNWYHIDLVYDDPKPDRPGQVLHNNFLLSDKAIIDAGTGHWGWESSIPCADDTYTQWFWQSSETRMLQLNDSWYYIDGSKGMMRRARADGTIIKDLYTFEDRWYVDLTGQKHDGEGENWWKGLFTGLGIYNGYFYFNTPTTIWRFNPASGQKMKLLTLEDEGLNIYGMDIHKNVMEYLVGDSPDRNTTAYMQSVPLRYVEYDKTEVENVFLPFEDVSRVSPYYDAVEYLYDNSLMNGMSKAKFDLQSNMTRAQFAAVLSRLYKYDPTSYSKIRLYDDVAPDSWYAPYVAWAAESGYMIGTSDTKFEPEAPVSREQMYTVLASVGRDKKRGQMTELQHLNTIDSSTISSWAANGVDYCYTNGLIPARYQYTLSPGLPAKRSDIAEVLYSFCQLPNN